MKHFTMSELTKSYEASRRGIDNTPTALAETNLYALVREILDPLREAYGKPIVVNSGYRCQALNSVVGGSKTSQHVSGQAADIEGIARTRSENKKLFDLILKLNLPFDQLINEYDYDWVHVSFSHSPRKQVLAAIKQGSKTIYQTLKTKAV